MTPKADCSRLWTSPSNAKEVASFLRIVSLSPPVARWSSNRCGGGTWPTILAWSECGKATGDLGTNLGQVVRSGGPEFVGTLSLGDFLVRGNTLWTLRRVDGRLLAYDLSEAESSALVSHELPLFFQMNPPSIVLRDSIAGETAVAAARHADGFAMDPEGNFFVEQFREDRTPILGTMAADGTGYRAFDLGVAQIRALAATLEHLFAAVVLPGEWDTVVLAYRSPFSRDNVTRATCHGAAVPVS